MHPPLRDLVEARIRFALDRQRASERADARRAAFVPYDTRTGLTVLPGAWTDWNDSRERIGTAQLLQQARRLGWGEATELADALTAYEAFIRQTLLEADGSVADDSRHRAHVRLYNFPWFARFLLDQGDLDGAVAILDRYYAAGGEHFLAFDLGPMLRDLGGRLRSAGRTADADRMRDHLLGHAAAYLAHADALPAHEVNYEQSMVAPLVELLLAAQRTDPDTVPADELTRRLRWLTAFAANQPDVRLRSVPIRFPEGSATCAFVYPSCVDGRPAHLADPLANDQDWALVYALRRLTTQDR